MTLGSPVQFFNQFGESRLGFIADNTGGNGERDILVFSRESAPSEPTCVIRESVPFSEVGGRTPNTWSVVPAPPDPDTEGKGAEQKAPATPADPAPPPEAAKDAAAASK